MNIAFKDFLLSVLMGSIYFLITSFFNNRAGRCWSDFKNKMKN